MNKELLKHLLDIAYTNNYQTVTEEKVTEIIERFEDNDLGELTLLNAGGITVNGKWICNINENDNGKYIDLALEAFNYLEDEIKLHIETPITTHLLQVIKALNNQNYYLREFTKEGGFGKCMIFRND